MKSPIIPSMKIGELLDQYPALEETLVGLSPQFKKLKNPVLRRTVAKIVSLQQAAATGGLSIGEVVNPLRRAAGQPELSLDPTNEAVSPMPTWMQENRPIQQLDVSDTIHAGKVPLQEILNQVHQLETGSILELIAPLHPSPIIEKLQEEGFKSWSRTEGDLFHTFFIHL